MNIKTEKRGRKAKKVDAEMFLQLAKYYDGKTLDDVAEPERSLFDYIRFFSKYANSIELIIVTQERIKKENPTLSDRELAEKTLAEFPGVYIHMDEYPISANSMSEHRGITNKTTPRNEQTTYLFFADSDVAIVDDIFKSLSPDDAKKLKQRLRKQKLNEARKYSVTSAKGINIDTRALFDLQSFADMYGLANQSIAISVMASIAEYTMDTDDKNKAVEIALNQANRIYPNIFKHNKDAAQINSWLVEKMILTDNINYSYYLKTSLSGEPVEAAEIKDSKTLKQMKLTNRINVCEDKQEVAVNSVLDDQEIKQLPQSEVTRVSLFKVMLLSQ